MDRVKPEKANGSSTLPIIFGNGFERVYNDRTNREVQVNETQESTILEADKPEANEEVDIELPSS